MGLRRGPAARETDERADVLMAMCTRARCDGDLPPDPEQTCLKCGGCRICGYLDAQVKGRCRPCYRYLRRTGHDRSSDLVERHRRVLYEAHLRGRLIEDLLRAAG